MQAPKHEAAPAPREWRIRPLQATDLTQVLVIEVRAYPFPWTESIFRDCLKAGYSAWVMTDAAGIIGAYAFLSMAVDEAHVLNLCVDPDLQRQGLGRQLLHHLIKLARAANATIVLLEVRKSNQPAIRLYDAEGFKRLGIRKNYYPAAGGREDAIVLGYEIV